jgi:hypothetical protein
MQSITNSSATGVKKPSVNLSADSIDLKALFMAKTVFLLDVLWKSMSRLCRCVNALKEIRLVPV